MPQSDHRHPGVVEILDQAGLVPEISKQHDRVALARLENGGQRERLIRLLARVAEHHRVSALPGLDRKRLDRACEEEVGDVAHDGTEQHRRSAAKGPRDRMRPIAELECEGEHALTRLDGERDRKRRVVEDARDGALGDTGGLGDIAHRHRPSPNLGARLARTPAHLGRLA